MADATVTTVDRRDTLARVLPPELEKFTVRRGGKKTLPSSRWPCLYVESCFYAVAVLS
jgi:hypothetical protein